MFREQPRPNEVEISLFGPGTGESVAVHLQDGYWIIVDSCVDRNTSEPAALQYLQSIGVDVSRQLRLVIATHWHDDHIKGLATIFESARNARFVHSAAYDFKMLIQLVELASTSAASANAVQEYKKILSELLRRKQNGHPSFTPAIANKKLLTLPNGMTSEVVALSPSDIVYDNARNDLQEAFASVSQRNVPISNTPNQMSIALWVRVGELNLLFGGDLEHVTSPHHGWNAILFSDEKPPGRALCLKVPHHGSQNAHCDEVWSRMLVPEPIALLAPYTPSRLPRPDDLKRLLERTPKLYMTASPNGAACPRRENSVEKTMGAAAFNRRALTGRMGRISVRFNAEQPSTDPVVDVAGGAVLVQK